MVTLSSRPARPSFIGRLATLLASVDQGIAWWGAHRAWPACEFPRSEQTRR